jgi:two-component system, LytTR family, sensor kinase
MSDGFTLRNIIDVDILQEIQDKFSEATGFGAIITDEKGIPVTNPSKFTSFCTYIRSSQDGLQNCIQSDQKVGSVAAKHQRPSIHYCHAGLVDLAAPIIINEKHLGSVLCGQVLMENYHKNQLDQIRKKAKHLINEELLQLCLKKIEFVNQQRIEEVTKILQLVTDYITQILSNNLAQRELKEKDKNIEKLMDNITKLEKHLEEAQLKILQTQINLHFFFNALNTISRLAYLENAEKTQDVTYSLSKIMRYSLRNIERLVTLREELEYTNHYINIEQYRFRNQIQLQQIVDVDIDKVKIPIFSIQPIVENAIKHGFDSQTDKIVIKIKGFLKDNNVVLEISDTGIGMNEEKISTIFSNSNINRYSHTTGIGIQNVQKRIQYYFGSDYGIKAIESKPGIGTTVKIVIPSQEFNN